RDAVDGQRSGAPPPAAQRVAQLPADGALLPERQAGPDGHAADRTRGRARVSLAAASLPLDAAPRRAWRTVLRARLALVDRRKYQRTVLESVDGLQLVVLPDVFNPKLLRSGAFLVSQLRRSDLLPPGSRVLDLGSGSGAGGLAAARRGCQ